jgi:hypothetical protein
MPARYNAIFGRVLGVHGPGHATVALLPDHRDIRVRTNTGETIEIEFEASEFSFPDPEALQVGIPCQVD